MAAVRGFLFYLVFAVTVIPAALTILITWPFTSSEWRYDHVGIVWARFMIRALECICGVRHRLLGLENIPGDGRPLVVLSKHQSAWETLFLPVCLPNRMGFVYKKSLHWIPFFGWALKSMRMIAIDRSEGRSAYQIFRERGELFLKRGWWVILFPEGTRTRPGAATTYKTGGTRFACSLGVDVLPVALNSGRLWPRNSIAKKPGTITVSFGPVISTRGREPHEVNAEVAQWIENEIRRWDVPEETPKDPASSSSPTASASSTSSSSGKQEA